MLIAGDIGGTKTQLVEFGSVASFDVIMCIKRRTKWAVRITERLDG